MKLFYCKTEEGNTYIPPRAYNNELVLHELDNLYMGQNSHIIGDCLTCNLEDIDIVDHIIKSN